MTQFSFRFPRAFRFKPVGQREEDALSLVEIGASKKSILVPYSPHLEYVVVSRGVGALPIESRDFGVETLGTFSTLWARLRLTFFFKNRKFLKFDEFYLFSVGPKTERRRFTRYNRDMMNVGIEFDSELVGRHSELVYGWPAEATSPSPATNSPADALVAVVAHIYYEDTWPDIAGALKGLTLPFDLIVTTVAGRERLIDLVRRSYPRAQVEILENCGRDIGPFLVLLERGQLDRYRYICKVHGKKSTDGGRETYIGILWRRRLLFDLLGGPGVANAAIDMFERDPSVGMIGPKVFRLPKAGYPEDISWSANRATTLKIAQRMGMPAAKFQLDFFGGTMFWIRPEALKPLRELRLAADMPYERGLTDGDCRMRLNACCRLRFWWRAIKLADSDGYEVTQASEGTTAGRPHPSNRPCR